MTKTREQIKVGQRFTKDFCRNWTGPNGSSGTHSAKLLCEVTGLLDNRFEYRTLEVLEETDPLPSTNWEGHRGGIGFFALTHPSASKSMNIQWI